MNSKQLEKLGVPKSSFRPAIVGVQRAAKAGQGQEVKRLISAVLDNPQAHLGDPLFGELAESLIDAAPYVRGEPIGYRTWGDAGIDPAAHTQMRQACALPMATGAALMPDAHVGYGLPIGGVLALDNAVCPYAVGVDIACRMKLSVLDVPAEQLDDDSKASRFDQALERGTRFGVGSVHQKRQSHAVLDADWSVSRVTRDNKDKARSQLGTSGSGNHFVEFGLLTVSEPSDDFNLAPGKYVALLSHSGSRGPGAAVCDFYSRIARARLPAHYSDLTHLGWLSLDSEEGQEYWAAMNLMGDFAAANHDVIHRLVAQELGADVIADVENHHNFAWREEHGGRDVIVHRKGATPAARGELGVIPGSMADPAFVVRGLGNPDSLNSASHGAGRQMSRTQAKSKFSWPTVRKQLAARGVRVLSAGADEVPGVYKNIEQVMAEQQDLVEIVARFDPRVVKMCGDGSRAED
ncbi:MAG: RtcB family protein [Pirellulales bacterium]|nr:RtcB family protein [Pirellulales bacterium]